MTRSGILAPRATPKEIVVRLNAATATVANAPEPQTHTPEPFAA